MLARFQDAASHPTPWQEVTSAPAQETVHRAPLDLAKLLPLPTHNEHDGGPYIAAGIMIVRNPRTGKQNVSIHRCQLTGPNRLGVLVLPRHTFTFHRMAEEAGQPLDAAIVIGIDPLTLLASQAIVPIDHDELEIAGALQGRPLPVVKCLTSDIRVPAEAEIVIEGLIDTEYLEPEAPFGESHGHVALEEYNMPMRVTAITHRRNPVIPSYISQVAPSESSVIKRVAYEPLFLAHLRDALGIRGVKRVALHEPLTGLLRVTVVIVEKGMPRTEVWRALNGAAFFKADCGKICIAVNEDIDPENADAIFWALAYRMNPVEDLQPIPHRGQGHGPKREHGGEEDSTLLMDATMKGDMPPLALPKREYMERARAIWEELGLPGLRPQPPWFGYSLGDWLPQWDAAAKRAVEGDYLENGRISAKQRRAGLKPETKFRPDGK
jgi:4-hydroxy-3-polyprenylbenzoate decarboxylase